MDQQTASRSGIGRVLGPSLVYGFGTAAALWTAWFITHVPWVTLAEPQRMGVVLAVWFGMSVWAGAATGRGLSLKVGALSGLTSALIGLLLLGAKIVPPEGAVGVPPPILMVVGFLATGMAIGTAGGLVGSPLSKGERSDWLAWFGVVAVLAAAPLLFIGGLVTTTGSGMAVPDWPRTFGANMFLYPLGSAPVDVFLEHSHRLFGTLVGLTTLVLMVWVWRGEKRAWVRWFATGVFAAVCVQGVLGGARVLANNVHAALVHAVIAQVIFAGLASLAVMLWATPERLAAAESFARDRKIKAMTTAAMHSTILQLIFGAAYRHLKDQPGGMHALWSHVGFSFIVLVAGAMAGFLAAGVPARTGLSGLLRKSGRVTLVVLLLQVLLGWVTLFAVLGTREMGTAESVGRVLLRTAHQANGALLLGVVTAAAVLAKMIYRAQHPREGAPS
jgi:cytochrome c oxidase assembly protein subunit 15